MDLPADNFSVENIQKEVGVKVPAHDAREQVGDAQAEQLPRRRSVQRARLAKRTHDLFARRNSAAMALGFERMIKGRF